MYLPIHNIFMPMVPNYCYHPRMMEYDFGPRHPLKPIRLELTRQIIESAAEIQVIDPGMGSELDLLRVHTPDYLRLVQDASAGERIPQGMAQKYGIGTGDTPIFPGMYEASLSYCAGSAHAAKLVNEGAPIAFNMSGGLHHAQRSFGSGFCVFNDAAIAASILRDQYSRVAYVDIDVHHGDGVEAIFLDDPTVMTCSIHQMSPGFYPGTGHYAQTGVDCTTVNIPLEAETTGDTWFWAFENGIMPALRRFQPEAIVLQMGADPHELDPLAHIRCKAQDWLRAVSAVQSLEVPIVALGGGGYNLETVARMWAAAVLTLSSVRVPEHLPASVSNVIETTLMMDADDAQRPTVGMDFAQRVIDFLHKNCP